MTATKTVIVTGGNSGIGLECAKAVARSGGWHVVITCRDQNKGDEAVRTLAGDTGSRDVRAMPLDLAALASVRGFVQAFAAGGLPPLSGLVCNAGTMALRGVVYTKDGFEENFGVNHLGHFLLANLLLPHYAPHARIVFESSSGHDPKTFAGRNGPPMYVGAELLARPDEATARKLKGMNRYTTSKLCNVLCAYEMARRLRADGRGLTVNAYDPGVVLGTGLGRDLGPVNRFLASRGWLLRLFGAKVRTAAAAGAALARLALDPALVGVTGRYFDGPDEGRSSDQSYDEGVARELWEASGLMAGLPAPTQGVEPQQV